MKEDYMHFLWRMRFLPSRNLLLTDGTEVEIIEFGEYNQNESGPDFFHAKCIINGVMWFGHIEFHLKASDWYRHNHHLDSAYDHVILHVVWEMDKDVFCQEKKLPTLLLSDYISKDYSPSHQNSKEKPLVLPCSYSLDEIEPIYIEKEKELALYQRMSRKTLENSVNETETFAQMLYQLIGGAFGAKVNRDPFHQLTKELPIIKLLKMRKQSRAKSLVHASGVFEKDVDNAKNQSVGLNSWQWKRKGLHPNGFPEKRVRQFASFIQHYNFDFGFLDLDAKELQKYIRTSFKLAETDEVTFSKNFQDLIIINAFVPFLWWLSEKRGEEKWQKRAIELLQLLPPERNQLTHFMENAGFLIHSAYDSQALLELYTARCSRKKCLTCTVGIKILRR